MNYYILKAKPVIYIITIKNTMNTNTMKLKKLLSKWFSIEIDKKVNISYYFDVLLVKSKSNLVYPFSRSLDEPDYQK